jgi:hypothetical protein
MSHQSIPPFLNINLSSSEPKEDVLYGKQKAEDIEMAFDTSESSEAIHPSYESAVGSSVSIVLSGEEYTEIVERYSDFEAIIQKFRRLRNPDMANLNKLCSEYSILVPHKAALLPIFKRTHSADFNMYLKNNVFHLNHEPVYRCLFPIR